MASDKRVENVLAISLDWSQWPLFLPLSHFRFAVDSMRLNTRQATPSSALLSKQFVASAFCPTARMANCQLVVEISGAKASSGRKEGAPTGSLARQINQTTLARGAHVCILSKFC